MNVKRYKIEMVVSSLLDEEKFKNSIVNCLTGVERVKGTVLGVQKDYKITKVESYNL